MQITHKALAGVQAWHQTEYAHSAKDRSSQLIGPGFDPVSLELWPFWTCGASVHIVPDAIRSSYPALVRFLAERSITVCLLPTPIAAALIDETFPPDCKLRVSERMPSLWLVAHSHRPWTRW